jgi:potassium-dependent mechanosensitive channel
MIRLLLPLSALLLCLFSLPAQAAEQSFPSLAQVPARAADLATQAVRAEEQMAELLDISWFETQLDLSEGRLRQMRQRMEQYGDPLSWNIDRLLDIRAGLQDERARLERVLQTLTLHHGESEQLRRTWSERRDFWHQWEQQLQADHAVLPRETFAQAQQTIESVLQQAEAATAPLVVLQEELTRQLNHAQSDLSRIDSALRNLRGQTFQRTGYPLFSADFVQQFTEGLMAEVRHGLGEAVRIDPAFVQGQGYLILAQVLVIFATAAFIARHRRQAQGTPEWRFILDHPWATGVFASMATLAPLYSSPPAVWRLVLWILLAFSAAVLISALVRNPLKRFTVYLLATVLVISLALQLINLPAPLMRLFLALVALVGMPLGLMMARYNIQRHQGHVNVFSLGLRLMALVSLLSFMAQAAGYSTLAAHLIDASIKSVFVGIFAMMTVRLAHGGIDFFLEQPAVLRRTFVLRFGRELAQRLKTLIKVVIWAGTFFNLLLVWGVYHNFGQAWGKLTGYGIEVGQIHLSLAMVLLSLLVIYLSIQASWGLRAVLDTQVFPHTAMDRGVSDAIKKLMHYSLVFVGFLLAMSLAGVEMRNFAVLAGAFGIGIGFGLQNIVNNFVSGLILLFERPIKVGDMIVVDEDWGTVRKIGLRSTVIETFDNAELIVPNSQLIAEKVTNWTLTTTRARVILPVGVAYGSRLELVMEILKEAALNHPLVLDDPNPSTLFVGFGDSSLDFELRCYIADVSKRLSVRSELGQYVDRRFREEGVEIPFPQRDLHVRSVDAKVVSQVRREAPQEAKPRSPEPEAK